MRLITFSSRERRKASLRFHYVSSLLVRGLAKILERILFRRESRRVCSKSRLLDNRYRCCFRRVKNHRCAIQPFYAPRFLSILFCFFFSFFLRATYAEFLGREEGSFFFFFFTLLYLGVIAREFRVNIRDFPARPGTVINLRSLRNGHPYRDEKRNRASSIINSAFTKAKPSFSKV